jgi:hypothetical protein
MTGRIQSRKTDTAASTLPEIGKVKIGEKAPNGNYPRSLDYFKPTGNFANEFTMKYGDKPTKLSVCFVSDDLNEVCNERYESWVKGKRWGYGDGNVFTVWDATANDNKGAYISNLPATDPRVKALKWDVMLTLRFVLLELKGIMGYWRFETKAKATTIPSVVKAFDFVRERAGTIIGFPFNLTIEKKTGYNPGEAKNYPVVSLVPNFSQDAIEMVSDYVATGGNVHKLTTAMIEQKKILAAGDDKKLLTQTTGGAQ